MDPADIYIREISDNAEFARHAYAEYLAALERKDLSSLFTHIHYFLIHITNIDKLIDCNKNQFRRNILASRVDFSPINLKTFRRLRNHLEHFDERIDAWIEKYYGCPFFDLNLVTGCIGFPKEQALRALDGHTYLFHGEEYDLLELYNELEKVITLVEHTLKHASPRLTAKSTSSSTSCTG